MGSPKVNDFFPLINDEHNSNDLPSSSRSQNLIPSNRQLGDNSDPKYENYMGFDSPHTQKDTKAIYSIDKQIKLKPFIFFELF